MLVETWYEISDKYNLTLAVLADIHSRKINEVLAILKKKRPDIILIPGDFVDGVKVEKAKDHKELIDDAVFLLNQVSFIAPTYCSLGNHEKHFFLPEIEKLYKSNTIVLQEQYIKIKQDIYIGGLSSGINYFDKMQSQIPDIHFINNFEKINGYKILLSHHPEYYEPYLKKKAIDLIISGHAHGGQVRLFDHGLYAPGQGLFPRYTSGIHDKKLIVSRGIAGTELFPRVNNRPEIVYVKI